MAQERGDQGIWDLVEQNREVANLFFLGKGQEGWERLSASIGNIQEVSEQAIQEGVLEGELAEVVFHDLAAAMESHDEVLLADTLQHGLNALLLEGLFERGEGP